jgi:hypothetical protein
MMIFGHSTADPDDILEQADGTWVASSFTAPNRDVLVSKLSIVVNGQGSGNAEQTLVGTIHDDAGNLLGYTETITIQNLAAPAWVDLKFATPIAVEASADALLGVIAGPTSDGAQLYQNTGPTNLYTASLSTPGTVSPGSAATGELIAYATYAYPWTPPSEDDLYLATLAYPTAQRTLGDPPDARTRRRVYATWHGTFIDPLPQGASVAIVQRGGELSDLVGERVRITAGRNRSTTVYIHRETDLDLDDDTQISLSRRAWQALSPLAADTLLVTTEVVPGDVE